MDGNISFQMTVTEGAKALVPLSVAGQLLPSDIPVLVSTLEWLRRDAVRTNEVGF